MATDSLETTIKSMDDAVKTFSLHPTGDYIALINGKGDLLIYRMVSEKGPLGKSYIGSNLVSLQNVLTKSNARNFAEGYRISWRNSQDGALQVCLPQDDGFPMIYTRRADSTEENRSSESWVGDIILTSDAYEKTLSHCKEYVNIVNFSPNGKYLASADKTGKILIWDVSTKDAITSYQCVDSAEIKQELRDLQWGLCDGDNYLIVLGKTGSAKINNVINTNLGHALPTGEYSEIVSPPTPTFTKPVPKISPANAAESAPSTHKRIMKHSTGDDDEDFDFTENISAIKSAVLPDAPVAPVKGSVIQDEDDDEPDIPADDMSDDLQGVDLVEDRMDEFLVDDRTRATISSTFHQPPFQPASTAYDERRRRYLVWNSVGSIVTRDEDIGNRIEIKFADTSSHLHKNEHFNDNYGFELGDLSSHGAIFATVPEDQLNLPPIDQLDPDEVNIDTSKKCGSTIFYKSFYSKLELGYFPNENFTYNLQYREVARCVTASVGWVAVVSSYNSLHYLRILSSTGMQMYISILKGSVVSICSSNEYLCVVYNSSGATMSSPFLLFDLYYITPITRSCEGRALPNITCLLSQSILPLSSQSSLQWIAFSNNSQVVSLDTAGQLLMLFHLSSSSGQWIPILDTNIYKKNIDYHIWPITVKTDKLCYVLLNGEKKPSIHPQPVVSAKPLRLPIIETKESQIKDKDGMSFCDRYRDYLWSSNILAHHQQTLEYFLTTGYPIPDVFNSSNESRPLDDEISESIIKTDKVLIKLFYEYCKKQRVSMAFDVVGRLVTTDALETAIKIANHFSKSSLAAILSEIVAEKKKIKRSLDQEFDKEVGPSSYSVPLKNGIATTKSPYSRNEDTESDFQLAQSSYPQGNGSTYSTQSYEYDFSQTNEDDVHTPEKFNKINHSILSNKKLTGPLFGSKSSTSNSSTDDIPKPIPVNKFAQSHMSSPKKKRNIHESLAQDLKGSPSPKKATLSRESSFSKEARSKRFHDKNIL